MAWAMWDVIIRWYLWPPAFLMYIDVCTCAAYWRDVCEHLMNMCIYEGTRVNHWLHIRVLEKWMNLWTVIVWGDKRLVIRICHSKFVEMSVYMITIYVHIRVFLLPHVFSCDFMHIYQYVFYLGNEYLHISALLNVCMSYSFVWIPINW